MQEKRAAQQTHTRMRAVGCHWHPRHMHTHQYACTTTHAKERGGKGGQRSRHTLDAPQEDTFSISSGFAFHPLCSGKSTIRAMSTILIVCLHTFVVFPLA